MDTESRESSRKDVKVEMCRFYSVRIFPTGSFMALCYKGNKAGIKCHSEARGRGCADYEQSDNWGLIDKEVFNENQR